MRAFREYSEIEKIFRADEEIEKPEKLWAFVYGLTPKLERHKRLDGSEFEGYIYYWDGIVPEEIKEESKRRREQLEKVVR